jgi:hypothetical protein
LLMKALSLFLLLSPLLSTMRRFSANPEPQTGPSENVAECMPRYAIWTYREAATCRL